MLSPSTLLASSSSYTLSSSIMAGQIDASLEYQNGVVDSAVHNCAPLSYSSLKPQLIIQAPRAADAIHFYKRAFGAEELRKAFHPKRKADQEEPLILHAHLKFGDAEFMICDESEFAGPNVKPPASLNGTTSILHLETNDVETAFSLALEAGASVVEEIAEQPWGQRDGKIVDPFGFVWSLATPTKEVAVEDCVQDVE